jgi:hypothetical protein
MRELAGKTNTLFIVPVHRFVRDDHWRADEPRCRPSHIRIASQPDVSHEVSAAEDHHEGHEEHEGEESKNKTLDAILQFRGVEVDQQSNLHASQFHGSQQLGCVNAFDLLDTPRVRESVYFLPERKFGNHNRAGSPCTIPVVDAEVGK